MRACGAEAAAAAACWLSLARSFAASGSTSWDALPTFQSYSAPAWQQAGAEALHRHFKPLKASPAISCASSAVARAAPPHCCTHLPACPAAHHTLPAPEPHQQDACSPRCWATTRARPSAAAPNAPFPASPAPTLTPPRAVHVEPAVLGHGGRRHHRHRAARLRRLCADHRAAAGGLGGWAGGGSFRHAARSAAGMPAQAGYVRAPTSALMPCRLPLLATSTPACRTWMRRPAALHAHPTRLALPPPASCSPGQRHHFLRGGGQRRQGHQGADLGWALVQLSSERPAPRSRQRALRPAPAGRQPPRPSFPRSRRPRAALAPKAKVLRDGAVSTIEAANLVPGDIVIIR